MDPSGLIFLALAAAWAAFLIPKALQHHEESVRSRSVERFSERMRVLARREPTSAKTARFVVNRPARTDSETVVEQKAVPPERTAARRAAIAKATRRRRNTLAVILGALTIVLVLAATSVMSWWYVAIPGTVLVAWLVACRVMVRSERGLGRPSMPHLPRIARIPRASFNPVADAAAPASPVEDVDSPEDTMSHEPVRAEPTRLPGMWDPVPVTLPTYVNKSTAKRTVRTIDLDSTGVWTSGRKESDSALVRDAEAAEKAERDRRGNEGQRAVGS